MQNRALWSRLWRLEGLSPRQHSWSSYTPDYWGLAGNKGKHYVKDYVWIMFPYSTLAARPPLSLGSAYFRFRRVAGWDPSVLSVASTLTPHVLL